MDSLNNKYSLNHRLISIDNNKQMASYIKHFKIDKLGNIKLKMGRLGTHKIKLSLLNSFINANSSVPDSNYSWVTQHWLSAKGKNS
jgi:hypothetical protein